MKNDRFDDFKFVRRMNRLNLWLQIFFGVLLYVGLNYLAARHYEKWDFSENRRNSLSPESVAYLKDLQKPVDIYVVTSGSGAGGEGVSAKRDLGVILRQYEYSSTSKFPVRAHFVNADIETRRAEELVRRFGPDLENSVIVSCGDKYRRIPVSDFYDVDISDGRRVAFAGERLISSAILNVSSGKENKIYFLRGHAEMDPNGTSAASGLSELAGMLTSRNYVVAALDLNSAPEIPADAGMIVIAGAQTSLLPREIDMLRKYLLKSNGRVLVFLRMGPLLGMEDILYEWGLMSDDMLILDSSGDYESAGGDLIARSFPHKPHAAVKYLIDNSLPVQFGSVRPVRPDLGSPIDDSLKLDALILSGPTSWAEKSYKRGGMQSYDAAADLAGPLPLAMIATRTGGSELGLKIPGGKLAVFGDEDFLSNRRVGRLGNSKMVVNLINWMFDETGTLNIPPRALANYKLTLSQNDAFSLALRFMLLPLAVFAVGVAVFIVRRN